MGTGADRNTAIHYLNESLFRMNDSVRAYHNDMENEKLEEEKMRHLTQSKSKDKQQVNPDGHCIYRAVIEAIHNHKTGDSHYTATPSEIDDLRLELAQTLLDQDGKTRTIDGVPSPTDILEGMDGRHVVLSVNRPGRGADPYKWLSVAVEQIIDGVGKESVGAFSWGDAEYLAIIAENKNYKFIVIDERVPVDPKVMIFYPDLSNKADSGKGEIYLHYDGRHFSYLTDI